MSETYRYAVVLAPGMRTVMMENSLIRAAYKTRFVVEGGDTLWESIARQRLLACVIDFQPEGRGK